MDVFICLFLIDNIEMGYCSPHMEWEFVIYPQQFQINFSFHRLSNISTGEAFEVRRLGFAPLMPLKVARFCSLF